MRSPCTYCSGVSSRRRGARCRTASRPVLALGLAALPAVPVLTGWLVPLLAFQGPVLVLLTSALAAVVVLRLVASSPPRAEPHAASPAEPSLSPALLFVAGFVFFGFLSTRMPGPAGPQGD